MDNLYGKLTSMQEISKQKLSKIFLSSPGPKFLVLESNIIRPLERVCGVRWLKDNGVEKIFKLEETAPNFGATPIFYMLYSDTATFKRVLDQIRSKSTQNSKCHLIVVPRSLFIFEEELEELGLLDTTVQLHSFQWFPIHLDIGVLSLELPQIYSELFLNQDLTPLPSLSKILWELFFVIGKPKLILALGQFSNTILKQVDIFNEDKGETDKFDSDFGSVVIMDRSADYPSVLLTPGTYSALLNEVYGVRAGVCEWKEEASAEVDDKFNPVINKQNVYFHLDSKQDCIYADIKNRHFTEVTLVLSNLTKELKNETLSSKDMALDEIKKYVQMQLQATKMRKKFISNHLLAAETIVNVLGPRYESQQEIESNIMKNTNKSANFAYLEELLSTENDRFTTLRLFCLMCVTQKLTDNEIKSFWRKFQHQFGYKYSWRPLIDAEFTQESTQTKLKIPKFASSNFYTNANRLKQIPQNPDKINLKYPTCASYVFGGCYIPLIVQIASMLLNSIPIDEIKTKLDLVGNLIVRNDKGYPLQPRSILIYVIGGITYAEIAACNLLETLSGTRIVVLSDCIVSGNSLMKQILDRT